MTFIIPTSIMISFCDISICIMISLSENHNYRNSIFIVLALTTKENVANNIRSAYTCTCMISLKNSAGCILVGHVFTDNQNSMT